MRIQAIFFYDNSVYLTEENCHFYGHIYAYPTIWPNICIDVLTTNWSKILGDTNFNIQLFDLQMVTQLFDSKLYLIKNPLIGQP